MKPTNTFSRFQPALFKHLFFIILILGSLNTFAQKRVIPGALYQPGDSLYGPVLGVLSKMPEGWMGVLPEDTEVFLLSPTNNPVGQVYVLGNELNEEQLIQNWKRGFELSDGLILEIDGDITKRDDKLSAKIKATSSSAYHGYIEAICGDYDRCLGAFMVTTDQFYDELKKGIVQLMDNTVMVEPYEKDIYADLDWTVFLANKKLISYEYEPGSKEINEVSLCENMTFQSQIKRKGALVKGDIKEYQGRKKGKWSVDRKGPNAILTLDFDKAPLVEIPIMIEDEKIFINSKRYFVLPAEGCK